ncbi:MAG TPA: hypothetical protein VF103_18460, partial [Polyangiaceae bacterium]
AFEFDTQFLVGETWGMVVEGSVARYRIGLRDGSATRLEPAIGAPQHALAQVLMNDGWAFGTTTGGSLLFYVDVESARVAPVDLSALAPFRRLDESNCAALPVLLDDGRLALALRDSATARMFLGRPSQSPWTRLGRPVSEVVSFAASHRSGAWILAGNSGNDTFCNGRIGAGSVIPEEALLGDSVQVVLHDQPEREIAFEGYALSEFVFHDSGLCAFARGTIYDFPSGERTALPFDASQVTFF